MYRITSMEWALQMNLLLWHFILMEFYVCIFTELLYMISELLYMIKNVFGYLFVISCYFVI